MTPWAVRDYVGTDGRNPVAEWYASQPAPIRAAMDAVLAVLRQTADWVNPGTSLFREFTKSDVGLSEIRFYFDQPRPKQHPTRRRFRVMGWYRPDTGEFVGYVVCEEQGMNYLPNDCLQRAWDSHRRSQQGLGVTHDRL
jgi:hypothetical protein